MESNTATNKSYEINSSGKNVHSKQTLPFKIADYFMSGERLYSAWICVFNIVVQSARVLGV